MRTRKSIKNIIWAAIIFTINIIVNFISRKIFIVIMGNEYNGLNSLLLNVSSMLSIAELGISNAIIYKLYKPFSENNKEKIKSLMKFYKNAYRLVAISVLAIGICILPFLKYIINDIDIDINIHISYILYVIDVFVSYLLSYKRSIFIVSQNEYIIKKIHLLYVLLYNTIQTLIIFLTKNYYLFLIIKILFTILENIIITMFANKKYPFLLSKADKLDKNDKKEIIQKIKALFVHKVAGFIVNGTDNILISLFFGIIMVGKYNNYFVIMNSLFMLVSAVFTAITPSIGNLLVEDNKEKNLNVYKKIKLINLIISLVSSCLLLALIQNFIILWLGKEYILDNTLICTIVIYYFYRTLKLPIVSFKDAAGIYYEDRFVPLIESIINVVFSIFFAKLLGLTGILIGTIISNLFLFVYSYPKFVYSKLFNSNAMEYYKLFFKDSIIMLFTLSLVNIINTNIIIKNIYLNMIFEIIIGLFIPIIIIIIIYKDSAELKYYLNILKKNTRTIFFNKKKNI